MKQTHRYFFLLPLCLFLLSLSANAQLRYSPGEITTQEGETLTGFLGEIPYTELRTAVLFKKSRSQKQAMEYKPSQLQSFTYADGDTFESQEVPCAGAEFYADGEFAFFHVLAKGKIDLYELNGRKATPLFIKTGEDILYLLCLSKSKDLDFRSILYNALEETIDKEDLDNLQLKRKYVQKLVDNFNNGTPLANIGDQPIAYPRLSIGVFGEHRASFAHRSNYVGLTKGASLELGVWAKKRVTLTASFQEFSSTSQSYRSYGSKKYVNQYELDADVWTIKGNFYPLKKGIASPYFFVGYQYMEGIEKTESENIYAAYGEAPKLIQRQYEIKETDFTFGGGLRFFFKRHSAYFEISKAKELLTVQLGYRFALWK